MHADSIALLPTPANDRDAQEAHEDVEYAPLAAGPDEADNDAKVGTDEQTMKPEERAGDTFAEAAAYVAISVIPVCTCVIVFTSNPTSLGWFFWHPILQSVSVALFAYGILTLQPTSRPTTKAAGLARHQIFMLALGFPAIFLGTLAIFINKNVHGQRHFTTWHGRLGLITICWMVMQIAVGSGSVWLRGRLFGGNPYAKRVWKYHRLSGYLLFPLLLGTTHLGGVWSHWAQGHVGEIMRLLVYSIAPAALLVAILVRIRPSKMVFF
ncbi:hypothetical protein B0H21DRAFT_274188 [Amylocystis lapponica]|nr:hypothetical protein B0H21DRAFT_274188 [Amylocystis lapponica]